MLVVVMEDAEYKSHYITGADLLLMWGGGGSHVNKSVVLPVLIYCRIVFFWYYLCKCNMILKLIMS